MPSSVYGPVHSWRFGNSLGIDLIVETSICSFNCIYCQLGHIQRITQEQRVYVPTERVISDLKTVDWNKVDVVTFSGSGEPTLATNIGEVIDHIRETYKKPVMILTNATWLHDAATRRRVWNADTIACKMDAWNDEMLRKFNRPAEGVTLARIFEGIKTLKAEGFPGKIAIQCMFMPMNKGGAREIAEIIRDVGPDEVHLNTPKRPYPKAWYLDSRGNHGGGAPVAQVMLKTISMEEADEIKGTIERLNPGVRILSVYRDAPEG